MMRRGRGRYLALSLVLSLLMLAGAACGSASSGEKVASVSGKAGSGDQDRSDRGQAQRDPEKAMLDFARCMRENGVDMPDPQPGGRGVFRFEAPKEAARLPDQAAFENADKACRHLMDDAGPQQLSPEDQKAVQDAMLTFARCMRDHGVDMPDPQPGGGILARVGEGPDPASPRFQAAEKECRKHTEALDKKLGVERSDG